VFCFHLSLEFNVFSQTSAVYSKMYRLKDKDFSRPIIPSFNVGLTQITGKKVGEQVEQVEKG
jgi:hypothetical protein